MVDTAVESPPTGEPDSSISDGNGEVKDEPALDNAPEPEPEEEQADSPENAPRPDDGSGNGEEFTLSELVASHLPSDFDPAIHAQTADGKPKLNADGSYRKKRVTKVKEGETPPGSVSTRPITKKPVVDTSGVTALALVGAIEAVAVNMVGDEWIMSEPEKNMQVDAWAAYLKANDMQDLPPGWALVLVTAIYAAPRFKHENTRARFAGIGGRVKNLVVKFAGIFKRK